MTGPLRGLAAYLLRVSTTPAGESTLPAWAVGFLAALAGVQPPQSAKPGSVYQSLVWQAVTMYQSASSRRGQAPPPGAWQTSADGTQAVQVLPAPQNDQQRQALLQLESLVQSTTINHPHLAPIFQTAFSQGYPYLAARLGPSAQALTKRFGLPMDPEQALRITLQVAETLEYAQHRGLIHGSLNLDDILVNERGQLTVLGVGVEQLRRLLGAAATPSSTTLAPPEVRAGEQADARADVFAVGALLFVLLTGKLPAAGKPVALAAEIPAVPPAVDAVLTKALAADPNDRYADLFEMSRALGLAIHSPKAPPKRPSPPQPLGNPAERARPSAPNDGQPPRQPVQPISGFPEPLPLPVVDISVFESPLEMPETLAMSAVAMPVAVPVPQVDWDSLLRPVDLSTYGGLLIELPHESAGAAADPMLAAVQAVRAVEARPPKPRPGKPPRQPTIAAPAATPAPAQPSAPRRKRKLKQ